MKATLDHPCHASPQCSWRRELHDCCCVWSAEALEKATEERAGLIASRTGDVLGAHTILKEDHFPGCQSAKLPNTIPGAPNFRGVPGQNVFGSALPTVDGIKAVLMHVGASSDTSGKRKVCVFLCKLSHSSYTVSTKYSGIICAMSTQLAQQEHAMHMGAENAVLHQYALQCHVLQGPHRFAAPSHVVLLFSSTYDFCTTAALSSEGCGCRHACLLYFCPLWLQVSAVWHNMREEPVIYINGRPFVLREDERPFKNMQEYTGIDVQRLEQMELRLKRDILQVLHSGSLSTR